MQQRPADAILETFTPPGEHDEQSGAGEQGDEQGGRRELVCAREVEVATGGGTDGGHALNEGDHSAPLPQLVGGAASVVAELVLFDGDDTEGGVGELVGSGELGHFVVAVVHDRLLPKDPDDGGRWVGLHVALEIHVVLHGLVHAWPYGLHHRGELHLDVDVAAVPAADTVVGDAVVGAAILLAHVGDLEGVALEDGAAGGKDGVVLPPPGDGGRGHASSVALQLHAVSIADHHSPSAVVEDVGRPPDEEVDGGRHTVTVIDEHLAHVLATVGLLKVLDLQYEGGGTSVVPQGIAWLPQDQRRAGGDGQVLSFIRASFDPQHREVQGVLHRAFQLH